MTGIIARAGHCRRPPSTQCCCEDMTRTSADDRFRLSATQSGRDSLGDSEVPPQLGPTKRVWVASDFPRLDNLS